MSAKRQAQYDIDQGTLQHKDKPESSTNQQPVKQSQKEQNSRNSILNVKKTEDNSNKTEEKKEEAKPAASNLFSSLFSNNTVTASNGSGIFSSTASSLFSNTTPGLFTNNSTTKPSTGLFGASTTSTQPKAGGLFSNNGSSTGSSIFNFQSGGVPPVKNTGASLFGQGNNEEDDSGDSAQLQAAQSLEADPSKSTVSYKYEETCQVILKQKAFKFKKAGGDLIENVDVVVTHDNSSKLYYISIQLPATKRSIYSGILLQQKSQVKHLNNKKENVEVSAFTIVKGKPEQAVLKCQFEKEQQGVQVHDTIEQIIKGTYVLKVQEKKDQASQQKASDVVESKSEKVPAQTKPVQ